MGGTTLWVIVVLRQSEFSRSALATEMNTIDHKQRKQTTKSIVIRETYQNFGGNKNCSAA